MRKQRSTGAGLVLALVSAFTFATSGTFAKSLIVAGWSPEAAVASRVGVAALILAGPAAWSMRGRWRVLWRRLPTVGVYGVLAVGAAQACYFNAVRYVPIGVALLLEYLGIVLVVGWMWLVHGQRPRRLTVAGSLVALVGLVLVLDVTGGGPVRPAGVLWGLGAALGLAAYFVISSRTDNALPPVALATGGLAFGAVLLIVLGALGAAPMRATFGRVDLGGMRVSWLVPVTGLSLVAAVVAYVTGIAAARALGPRLSSFTGLTEVLFAVLFAWAVLGQLPTAVQMAGGALIVTGVALVHTGEPGAAATAATATGEAMATGEVMATGDGLAPRNGTVVAAVPVAAVPATAAVPAAAAEAVAGVGLSR